MTDSPSPWLWPGVDDQPDRLPGLGEVLREYRAANHLTQAALGGLLQVDQTYISLIERSRRQIRDVGFLLRVARLLGIPPADLGLSNDLLSETAASGGRQWRGAMAGGWRGRRKRCCLIRVTGVPSGVISTTTAARWRSRQPACTRPGCGSGGPR